MYKSENEDNNLSPGPTSGALVVVKYGYNKTLAVNPNAGLSGVMELIRQAIRSAGLPDVDHIELCDESGKLINPSEFPSMMLLSSFIKPDAEEVYFIPVRVERDGGKQILKLDPLLADAERVEPEMMMKMKKENHVAKERRAPKGETLFNSRNTFPEEALQSSGLSGSAHTAKAEGKRAHGSKNQK